MRRVSENDFKQYIPWARMSASNRVYPLSIVEGFQSGDVFVNDGMMIDSVLFWHYCGFGYISGNPSDEFLDDIYAEMMSVQRSRRLVLISDDVNVLRFFEDKEVLMDGRIEYDFGPNDDRFAQLSSTGLRRQESHGNLDGLRYQENLGNQDRVRNQESLMDPESLGSPDRFRIERIDKGNISRIEGRIIPSFSWKDNEQFLESGFGYIALEGENVCAVTFSSAVSTEEIDIGVETQEVYRRNGLATVLARKMCEHIVRVGKKPVWAHAESNLGSMSTALRCGFIEKKRNTTIRAKSS